MSRLPKETDEFDPESGVIRSYCFNCKHQQVRVVRVLQSEDQMGQWRKNKTLNVIGVCSNKNCWRYQDISDSKVWVLEDYYLEADPRMRPDKKRAS